jgi:hypothetical protein
MKNVYYFAALLVGLVACEGAAPSDIADPVAATEEASTCLPAQLTGTTCSGAWQYHASCDIADSDCGEDPNGTCTSGNSCNVVNGSRDVREPQHVYNVPQECDEFNGHPRCHRETRYAEAQCNAAANAAYDREVAAIPEPSFRNLVQKLVNHDGSSPSSGFMNCNITIRVPTWAWSNNDIAHCGCAHHSFRTCTRPPAECPNPELRYSRDGLTFDQIRSETNDPAAICLTGDTLPATNPAAIFDRLQQTWDMLAVVDGSFEGQPTRNPVTSPWFMWGGGGIDIGLGFATYERNNGFLWAETGTWSDLHQTVLVVPGQTYTVSAYLKSESSMRSGYFGVRPVGQGGTFRETTYGPMPAAGGRVSTTFTAPAGVTSVDLYIGMWGNSNAGRWVQIDGVNMTPASGIYGEPLHQRIVRRMRLLYNLYGSSLDATRLARLRAITDGYGANNVPLECGDAYNPPTVGNCASADEYRHVEAVFQRCSTLIGTSVSPRLASRELMGCLDNLSWMGDLRGPGELGPDEDLACNGPEIRDWGSGILVELLRRQFKVIVDSGATPGDTELASLAGLGRQLALIDRWYQAAVYSGVPEKSALDSVSYALRGFWDAVYQQKHPFDAVKLALADIQHPPSGDTLTPLLHDLTNNAFTVEKDVLTAAYTTMATIPVDGLALGRTPMTGAPLLLLTADGLGALSRRVDDMSVFHDFGCTFRTDCPTAKGKTPLATTWKLLAALGNTTQLTDALTSAPPLSGWRDVFTKIAANHAQLDAAAPAGGFFAATDPQLLPRGARDLAVIVRLAKRRVDSFALTGQFDPMAEHTLAFGVDVDSRNAILNEVRGAYTTFDSALKTYNRELVSSLASLVGVVDSQANAQHLTVEMLRLGARRDALAEDVAGLVTANDADEVEFADIVKRFDTIKASIDSGVYVPVGNSINLDFTGASALSQGTGNTFNMTTWTQAPRLDNLQLGQMLQLEVSGDYRPSCALRQVQVLSPADGTAGSITAQGGASASEAVCGPEGYVLSWNHSQYQAQSHAVTGTETARAGINTELCATTGLIGKTAGVEGKACAYASYEYSKSWSVSNSDGSQNNSSASFSGGLRLSDTPFPTMPAGALLVVFADRSSGAIADVKVVTRGNNAILVPAGNLAAYFIVNDRATGCGSYDTSRTVHVAGRVLQDQVTASRPMLARMALVLGKMRALETTVLAQGRVLPSQAASSRSEALSLLDATQLDASGNPVAGTNQDNIPLPVRRLFEAFVDRQILRTERLVELKQIGREQKLLELELRNLKEDTSIGAERSRLQALVTRWSARNLDSEKLRLDAMSLLHLTRSYFLPILEIWYPAAIERFSNLTEVNNVLDADITTSVPDMANLVNLALGALYTKFADAARGQKPPAEEYTWVAVTIPNPYYTQAGFYPRTSWARSEATQAYSVWDAIHQRRSGRITIRPEDIYGQGDFRLGCQRHNPVIQKIGLYVVRPGEPDYRELNSPQRDFQAAAGGTEVFAQTSGPVTYTLASDEYNVLEMPIIYGEALQMRDNARPKLTTQPAVGLSPFTSFDVDFSEITSLEQGDPGAGFEDDFASELVVVMQVDSRLSSSPMSWIRACR